MKFRQARKKSETEPSPLPQQYIDEAGRSGSEEKVREGFARKLARIATDNPVVNLARDAYRYMTDPKLPTRYKVMLVAALLYFLAPIDTVPDAIPGLGYVDDIMVLSAIVTSVQKMIQSVRDNAKEVIREGEEAAERVVSHALSEARETWARRGVTQFALCLWGSTTAAFVGLIYYGAKRFILDSHAPVTVDPFSWAVIAAACLGLFYNLFFLIRVWEKYSELPSDVREPLAYAVVSLMDWRQIWIFSMPLLALLIIIILRLTVLPYLLPAEIQSFLFSRLG